MVLETATGRVVRTYGKWAKGGKRLYWLGGEGTERDPEVLVAEIDCASRTICGGQPFNIIDRRDPGSRESVFWGFPTTALREGLVIQAWQDRPSRGEPKRLLIYGPEFHQGGDTKIPLPRMLPSAPFRVVADVAHSRLFAISSAGLVAEIDRIGDPRRRERVRYHRVELNGRSFDAAWAGAGKLALWGNDGLGTIDTRTWKTHHIAPGVVGAVATPFGIAAWGDPADGLTVYRPDGRMRLRVLVGKRIASAQAVGGYLYVDTSARPTASTRLTSERARSSGRSGRTSSSGSPARPRRHPLGTRGLPGFPAARSGSARRGRPALGRRAHESARHEAHGWRF